MVAYMSVHGFPGAERCALGGAKDKGDIKLCPGVVLEVKNQAVTSLAGWLRETAAEQVNAGAEHGLLVVKPPGLGLARTGQWWLVMYGHQQQVLLEAACARAAVVLHSGARVSQLGARVAATAQAVREVGWLPFVQVVPKGVTDPRFHYLVTTLEHGAALLLRAGYGSPLATTLDKDSLVPGIVDSAGASNPDRHIADKGKDGSDH